MGARRSLSAGLEQIEGVDPAVALAFIAQERPRPQKVHTVAEKEPVREEEPVVEFIEEQNQPDERGGEGRTTPAPVRKTAKPTGVKRPDTARLLSTLLVPVTIRLRPEIAAGLKRASLQRQLNGIEMFTQQDIVEEALIPWLKAEGLLD
jgi:hypothetical protein